MNNEKFYKDKVKNGSDFTNPETVGWHNKDLALKRYEVISAMIPVDAKRVADFGCGTGIFTDYLPEWVEEYTGYDIMPEYIQIANDTRANGRIIFKTADVDKVTYHDCIVSIGTFTLRFDWPTDEEYAKYFEEKVKDLLTRTKTLVINGFSKAVDSIDPKLYYHDMNLLFKIAKDCGFIVNITNVLVGHEFVAIFTKRD